MFTLKSPGPIRRTRLSTVLGSVALCLGLAACQTPPAPASTVAAPVADYRGPILPIEQSERIPHLLKTKTTKKVSIEGHTDNAGALAPNQALSLSLARANSLVKALTELGVPAERLAAVGYAFNRPVASNATPDGRQLNRRVEILILDEKVETITQGEPANAFESAWDKLKKMIEQGLVKPVESKS